MEDFSGTVREEEGYGDEEVEREEATYAATMYGALSGIPHLHHHLISTGQPLSDFPSSFYVCLTMPVIVYTTFTDIAWLQ